MRRAQQRYEASTAAAQKARRFVNRVLTHWDRGDVREDANLLTSEIVADAVRQQSSQVTLLIEQADGVVRVEVSDDPGLIMDPKAAAFERRTGRRLVHALARRWGSDTDLYRTATWFELPRRRD
ncbi:MAG: ATP-binding protein [Acidimicrobiia bacterium]